jgi:hypothetical protein
MNARLPIAALLMLGSALAQAQVYRCTEAGRVTYQAQPCASAGAGRVLDIPAAYPEVNLRERDRLLQREAALDARLLKRAELEAAERVARENRRARELEAQAERERARAVEPAYVVAWAPPLRRNLRPRSPFALPPRY